ncbi:MAG: hypothetical protein Q8904_10915 [Bacteroidota bacterium]|nr:hypothetical protein [Bacteroidota bacterium]
MNNFFIGNNPVKSGQKKATGQFVRIDDEKFYQIKNFDSMQPFFISLASDSNLWMYISSTGGLTAGRKNPDQALFPYYTDDKINESAETTGSKTIFHVRKGDNTFLWEPFSDRNKGVYVLERSIFKSTIGNKLIFSEKNFDLGLTFCYAWMNADDFGWIKKSWLINDNNELIEVTLVDGMQNILPAGIDRLTQNTFSTLVDGYKKTELVPDYGLALFRMESILVDRAEPSESLRVNTVWNYGLDQASYLLSSAQLNTFRSGQDVFPEQESKGVRGAFFASNRLSLEASETKTWYFVAETNQDAAQVNNLTEFIRNTKDIACLLEKNIEKGTRVLQSIVAQADGIQQTADENDMARHFSNVLFNTMRGGIYSENYTIYAADFNKQVKHFNVNLWKKHGEFLNSLPVSIGYAALDARVHEQNDANLYRLFQEYLPLTFSRRHGDPSRPWNLFNIHVKDEAGNKLLSYQGNWRDIFQNWEALSLSFPGYINGIIAKFLNASTADGYNPYKVTSEGIDWEVIEPENPWSNIGYWGDHQIIYLLKLMEVSRTHYPDSLVSWLDKDMFAYANVPYRLKSYTEIVAQPKNTIRFDDDLHKAIEKLLPSYGADARLILNPQDEVMLVTFTEKLLAALLAKLSNFIPEAGIWMNTLRPEWNDANNALVGTGASMVTLYYMRRFLTFAMDLYQDSQDSAFHISAEMAVFFVNINAAFINFTDQLETGFNDQTRRSMADELGQAGSDYRESIYRGFSGSKRDLDKSVLQDFFALALRYVDQSIEVNKRADHMYHAYNLVTFSDNVITIRHLYEMLEGQVAVLTSGKLTPVEALELLDALRNSSLYRPDQESYILYPNKRLPLFLDKNLIPKEEVGRIKLLTDLVAAGDTNIIKTDQKGDFHFNADFHNAGFLTAALNRLKAESAIEIAERDQLAIEQLYERLFDHQSFTGRSGTFYKYEGLGCIYWHMVSKLLLAVGENISGAALQHAGSETMNRLMVHYNSIQKGIGAHKSPAVYGSFPFDPYSHTPTMAGVQQPGMTGQVKEDIINRFFELGVTVRKGQLRIQPLILKREEFIQPSALHPDQYPMLSFTYCSIPFIYQIDGREGVDMIFQDQAVEHLAGYSLNHAQSERIFNRDATLQKIIVHFKDTGIFNS